MNRYIYHYSARYQTEPGAVAFIDGIAQLKERIVTHEDYKKIKPLIEPVHYENLTITSLSFLGMELAD